MPDTTTALTLPLMSPVPEKREGQVLHTPVVLRLLEWMQNLGATDEGHALRVMALTLSLNVRLAWVDPAVALQAGLLHDIGKVMVSSAILNKPAALTRDERAVIELHPVTGAILARVCPGVLDGVIPAILHHHEAFNGLGYPHALLGVEIPPLARILAVADVYDALTSDRPYRSAWTPEETLNYMLSKQHGLFDPVVLVALKDMYKLSVD
jgi:putative nucleotidyltransferase with HDIG domain